MAYYANGTLIGGANTLPKMTMAEYLALPADQRPTYWECTDKDYDEISAENVSYGSGTVKDALDKAGKFTKLWENPNPSEAFSEQTITLASGDYDFLLMMAKQSSGIVSNIAPKGNGIWLSHTNSNITSERRALYISTTSFKIQDATANGNVNNNAVIPIAVYGIKL